MADYIPVDSVRVSAVSGYSADHNQHLIYGHGQGPLVSCQGSFRLVNHHRQPNHTGGVRNWNHHSRSPAGINYNSFDLENQLPIYVKMEEGTNEIDESVHPENGISKDNSFDNSSRSSSEPDNDTTPGNENDSQEGHLKHGKVDPKICGVCGDKALGNNFNAITCESCKAFFRRNALKTKEFVCPFSDTCKVDPVTRRFCQKCRLKKCFEIGMKKEWIMTDEEKKVKKQKIEQNRLKRASSDVPLQNESPATKVAVCMVDQKVSHPGRPIGSTIPNSPPDPTVPHKIAKQPMMPHTTTNGMNITSTTCLVEETSIPMCIVQNINNTNIPVISNASNSSLSVPLNSSVKTMSSSLIVSGNCNSHITNISTNTHTLLQSLSANSNVSIEDMSCGDNSPICSVTASQVDHHHPQQITFHEQEGISENCHNQQLYNQRATNVIQHSPPECKLSPSSSPGSGSALSSPISIDNQMQQLPSTSLSATHGHQHQHQNLTQSNSYHYLNSIAPTASIQHSEHEHQPMIWGNINQGGNGSASNSQSGNKMSTYYHQSTDIELKPYALPTTMSSGKTDNAISTAGQFQTQIGRVSASETYCPTSHLPLLSSLIRPGTAESPPDEPPTDCQLNHNEMEMATTSASPHEDSSSPSPRSIHSGKYIQAINSGSLSQHEQTEEILGDINFGMSEMENRNRDMECLVQHPASSFDDDLVPLPLNTMDSILSVAITAEFNGSGGVLGRNNVPRSKDLNKAERSKLSELLLASQALNAPVDAEGPIKGSETSDPSLINVINLTDVAIRRLIKMSKKISGFKNMCQEDQIALLKGSCTEMMILRSVVSYDPDRDSWNIPHSNVSYNIKLGVLKEARGNLYEEHQRFVKSFKPEWRSDENIMIILCAITLFCAERPNVIHKDVVKLEQDSYYYLLKRYLESILNGCEARSTYLQLIKKIAELHILNSNHLRVFLEVNPREVEPLLIEIFDLKQ